MGRLPGGRAEKVGRGLVITSPAGSEMDNNSTKKLIIFSLGIFLLCKKSPVATSIKRWNEMFKETGRVKDLPRSDRPRMSEATVEYVLQSFQWSPT
ncbi:hypothetical protein TNCV_3659661 [Trichonephila clavipes]|nr:hypothetical protein TNCV_3659661 [Trichonephila clavipes]